MIKQIKNYFWNKKCEKHCLDDYKFYLFWIKEGNKKMANDYLKLSVNWNNLKR
jgi:hypothetical protein